VVEVLRSAMANPSLLKPKYRAVARRIPTL
jgi:hypothetical protein